MNASTDPLGLDSEQTARRAAHRPVKTTIYILAQHYADAEQYAVTFLNATAKTQWRGWRGADKERGEWHAVFVNELEQFDTTPDATKRAPVDLHVPLGGEKSRIYEAAIEVAKAKRFKVVRAA